MTAAPRDAADPAPASDAPSVIHLGAPPDLARPKKTRSGSNKRQRSAGILVKLTPADHRRVKADAAAAGMSAAAYLASGRLAEETATRPRMSRRRVPADEAALLRALAAFNRASNNLNQVARTGNLLMLFAEDHGAPELTAEAREIGRAVEALRNDIATPLTAILAALTDVREG